MLPLSPGEENVETIEEETIEELVQRNYTETLEEIDKDNFMFSIGKESLFLYFCSVLFYFFLSRSVDGTNLWAKDISLRKAEKKKEV